MGSPDNPATVGDVGRSPDGVLVICVVDQVEVRVLLLVHRHRVVDGGARDAHLGDDDLGERDSVDGPFLALVLRLYNRIWESQGGLSSTPSCP